MVDTNVVFSALLSTESRFAVSLLRSEPRFYVCESVLAELFRRKEKILRLSHLDDEDLTRFSRGSTTFSSAVSTCRRKISSPPSTGGGHTRSVAMWTRRTRLTSRSPSS